MLQYSSSFQSSSISRCCFSTLIRWLACCLQTHFTPKSPTTKLHQTGLLIQATVRTTGPELCVGQWYTSQLRLIITKNKAISLARIHTRARDGKQYYGHCDLRMPYNPQRSVTHKSNSYKIISIHSTCNFLRTKIPDINFQAGNEHRYCGHSTPPHRPTPPPPTTPILFFICTPFSTSPLLSTWAVLSLSCAHGDSKLPAFSTRKDQN